MHRTPVEIHAPAAPAPLRGNASAILAAALRAFIGATPGGMKPTSRQVVFTGLKHRGQPPAKGILSHRPARYEGKKSPSRRDKHRAKVRALKSNTAGYNRSLSAFLADKFDAF